MCGVCCICKTCCCGQKLNDGVFIWALLDILFHIAVFPLPLLLGEMVFFAPSFDLWIIFLLFADVVLILGEKSGRPALLTLWLVVFFINILLLIGCWVTLGIAIYLVEFTQPQTRNIILVFFQISEGQKLPFLTRVETIQDILSHPFNAAISAISLILMTTVLLAHIYFWVVVWSLRKRMCMDIAIGFDENSRVISRGEVIKMTSTKVAPVLSNNADS